MSSQEQPPHLTRRLLRFFLPSGIRGEAVLGDLEEEFHIRAERDGGSHARWWYRRQALWVMGLYAPPRRRQDPGAPGWPGKRRPLGLERLWEQVVTGVAHGWRSVRKRPGFAVTVVLTLGLGIGANTAVFALLHAVVLSPLPYEDSEELYSILERHTSGRPRIPSYPTFLDWRAEDEAFEDLAFARGAPLTYLTEEHTGLLLGSFVTDGFFEILGVPARLGRTLIPDDYRPESEGAVVLSDRAWRRWFGGDHEIIGTVVVIDELAFAVVGVMPPSFAYPDWGADNDLWLPISRLPPSEVAALEQRGFSADSRVVGRLHDGVTPAAAQRSMNRLAAGLAAAYPEVSAGWTTAPLESLKELEIRAVRPRLLMLWASVLLVLLLCCLNLANLYLVQGSSRRREYALRLALGAHRTRVFRQIGAEALFLAFAGGLLGVLSARWGIGWARGSALAELPRIGEMSLDVPVLIFASILSLATALVFTCLVARQVGRGSLHEDLRGARGGTGYPTSLLSGIQAVQVGMTFVLLSGAWLLGETYLNLSRVDPGYDPAGVLVMQIEPPSPDYDEESAAVALYSRLMDEIRSLPGVTAVALTNHGPGGRAGAPTAAAIGHAPRGSEDDIPVIYRTVSAGYFSTLGTPVVAGREFTRAEIRGGEGPVIVNETLASLWGGSAAVGQTIGVDKAASSRADFGEPLLGEVVGVVRDLDASETGGQPVPTVYVPFTHTPWSQVRLLVRASGATRDVIQGVEEVVRSVEPRIPVSGPFVGVRRLEDLRSEQRAQERLNAGLVGAFAGIAVILAAIGMYGVIAFMVTLRTREIGVRLVLGATPGRVAGLMVRQATLIGLAGLTVGGCGALLLSSLVTSLLFQVDPLAVERYGVVASMLLCLTAGAAYVPARRASRMEPVVVLRAD